MTITALHHIQLAMPPGREDDARAHEIMLCIQTGKTMSDPNRMRFEQPAFYLKTREEMLKMFDYAKRWEGVGGPGHWPDCDMIQIGKISKRGPVGPEQLTTFRYQVRGTGQIRK